MKAAPAAPALEEHLRRRLDAGRKLLVPYLTAGLPSPREFPDLAAAIGQQADALEVGIPFSDPVMDGPVIQAASHRALEAGVTLDRCFALLAAARERARCPLVVMTYYNPVHRIGAAAFARAMGEGGVTGVIVPDLPFDESAELTEALAGRGIASIRLVAPTTPPERARLIVAGGSGFVYAVARLGVTGERDSLGEEARVAVQRVRPHTALPVLLGIGIATGEQAREAAALADGVIVGSAIMRRVIEDDVPGAVRLAGEIRAALDERGG